MSSHTNQLVLPQLNITDLLLEKSIIGKKKELIELVPIKNNLLFKVQRGSIYFSYVFLAHEISLMEKCPVY